MIDKKLFLHDLAIVAILKNEGNYLKEWLDYHLLAGVDHFYLYDNDSTDNQAEVAKPYVEAGLVDYFFMPGKMMQYVAYNDTVKNFKFFSRYMAFVDLDEFIFPKTNQKISEVVDEILSRDENAAGLSIHWQCFGSNGLTTADHSRGVLERFTRRAEKNFAFYFDKNKGIGGGNVLLKCVANPRLVKEMHIHYAKFFENHYTLNENGMRFTPVLGLSPVAAEKIVINHYFTKSLEEFRLKQNRGKADNGTKWPVDFFNRYDRNEVFDDGILKYRAARAENFSLESSEQKFFRVTDALIENLSAEKISLEAALTCRALSSHLLKKFPQDADSWKICEEKSLDAILKSLNKIDPAQAQLFIRELPKLLRLPYPSVKKIRVEASKIISWLKDFYRLNNRWEDFFEPYYLQDFFRSDSFD